MGPRVSPFLIGECLLAGLLFVLRLYFTAEWNRKAGTACGDDSSLVNMSCFASQEVLLQVDVAFTVVFVTVVVLTVNHLAGLLGVVRGILRVHDEVAQVRLELLLHLSSSDTFLTGDLLETLAERLRKCSLYEVGVACEDQQRFCGESSLIVRMFCCRLGSRRRWGRPHYYTCCTCAR